MGESGTTDVGVQRWGRGENTTTQGTAISHGASTDVSQKPWAGVC